MCIYIQTHTCMAGVERAEHVHRLLCDAPHRGVDGAHLKVLLQSFSVSELAPRALRFGLFLVRHPPLSGRTNWIISLSVRTGSRTGPPRLKGLHG